MNASLPHTVFVGHPFSSIGKGEELRSAVVALAFFDHSFGVVDVHRYAERSDPDHVELLKNRELLGLGSGVRVFHINGDEVDRVLESLEARGEDLGAGVNVIVPAWELPIYPQVWLDALRRFDEVWAISAFVQDALAAAGIDSVHVGQSVQVPTRPFLPRRHFSIRASSFVFLAMFDLSSFSSRKNPEAVVAMYRELRQRHPYADMQLVLKVKNGDRSGREWIEANLDTASPDIVLIESKMTTHEVHSLIAACDCLVSLHRSEGFGRSIGEAMWLGRASIATGWSGNMDFTHPEYPCSVGYTVTPVLEGQYPHHQNQVWAEPDLDHAIWIADKLLTDHNLRREAVSVGQASVVASMSNRAVGLRMLARIDQLAR